MHGPLSNEKCRRRGAEARFTALPVLADFVGRSTFAAEVSVSRFSVDNPADFSTFACLADDKTRVSHRSSDGRATDS